MTETTSVEQSVRNQALKRLKKKRDFRAHLLVYLLVNTFIVVIWAVTSAGFFWPIFPMVGWGIGLVMNAWDVWHGEEFTEEEIKHEISRLQHGR